MSISTLEEVRKNRNRIKQCRRSFSRSLNKRMSDTDILDYLKGYTVKLEPKRSIWSNIFKR